MRLIEHPVLLSDSRLLLLAHLLLDDRRVLALALFIAQEALLVISIESILLVLISDKPFQVSIVGVDCWIKRKKAIEVH